MNARSRRSAVAAMLGAMALVPMRGRAQEPNPAAQTAQSYIDAFRRGEDFAKPLQGLVQNHQVNRAAVAILAKELSTGTPEVRERLVRLLAEVALEADDPGPGKLPVIRDPAIIKALLTEGFAKSDAARSAAARELRLGATPADLAKFQDLYMEILSGPGASSILYLVAKAQTLQARSVVERMAAWPELQGRDSVKVAQAALGNTAVEDAFIEAARSAEREAPPAPKNRFYDVGDAKDGKQLVEKLELLGMIGTRRSLLEACSYLRSPLKTYLPNYWERSVRLDALAAIAYNFPDERLLVKVRNHSDYVAAERFCSERLGAVFSGPTPELPADRAYPRMRQ